MVNIVFFAPLGGGRPHIKRREVLVEILKRTTERYQDSFLWACGNFSTHEEVTILKQHIIFFHRFWFNIAKGSAEAPTVTLIPERYDKHSHPFVKGVH